MVEANHDNNPSPVDKDSSLSRRARREAAILDLNNRLAEGREEFRASLDAQIAKHPPIPATNPTTYEVSRELQELFARTPPHKPL